MGRKGSREEGELAAGPTGLDATAFAFSRIQTPPVISTSAHVSANSNPLSQGGHLGSSTQALYQRDSIPAPATRSVHRQHPLSTSHTLAAGLTLTPDTLSRPSSTFNSLVLTTTLECQQGLISSLPTLPPRHPSPSLAASTRPTSSTHPALSPEHSTTRALDALPDLLTILFVPSLRTRRLLLLSTPNKWPAAFAPPPNVQLDGQHPGSLESPAGQGCCCECARAFLLMSAVTDLRNLRALQAIGAAGLLSVLCCLALFCCFGVSATPFLLWRLLLPGV